MAKKVFTDESLATLIDETKSYVDSAVSTKANSSHTHNYADSSSAGGAATSANKVNSSLIVKLNGGSTEGTNLFTFNGSAAKSVNITPSAIGAAASSHTHDDRYYTETEVDNKLSGKAPTSHASTATTYGIGTSSNYGHVKLSDSTSSTSDATAGIAASPAAVKAVYDLASGKSSSTHTHTVSHTPAGTVSQPTFTGSAATSGAPSKTTSVYSITDVGSAPSLTASVTNRCLTLSFDAGSVPTRSSVTVASSDHTHSVTAKGSVSQPTFTGTAATLTSGTPK